MKYKVSRLMVTRLATHCMLENCPEEQELRRPHAVLDPDVADLAPSDPALTAYDQQHAITYVRLLDADAQGADWRDVARIVLRIDPERDPDRARQAIESHLARAKWVARHGYRHLLRHGWPRREPQEGV